MTARHRVLLVRHGESEWNRLQRWQGHGGGGLTARGREQAETTAAFLQHTEPKVAGLVSSDLPRSLETAEPLAKLLDLTVVETDTWREIDVGNWSGLTHEEIAVADPQAYASWRAGDDMAPGGGESASAHRARIRAALEALADMHDEGTVVVFTHGGPIRASAAEALGLAQLHDRRLGGVGNCSVSELALDDGRWRLVSYNATSHLMGFGTVWEGTP